MKKIGWLFHAPLLTILIGIFACWISVWYFTSSSYFNWNFTSTGQIGDTIGGLTAPVIGLLNAVLLYITLRRQDQEIGKLDQHRSEDQLNSHYLRVVESIDSKISTLVFSIDTIDGLPPDFLHFKGPHNGQVALSIARQMFGDQSGLLPIFRVSPIEWEVFLTTVNEIVFDVEIFLNENATGKMPMVRREINFQIIRARMQVIFDFYENVELYAEANLNDEILDTFQVERILRFKMFVDNLGAHDPSNFDE